MVAAYVLASELAASRGDHAVAFPAYERALPDVVRNSRLVGPSVLATLIPRSRTPGMGHGTGVAVVVSTAATRATQAHILRRWAGGHAEGGHAPRPGRTRHLVAVTAETTTATTSVPGRRNRPEMRQSSQRGEDASRLLQAIPLTLQEGVAVTRVLLLHQPSCR
jgi:hypothetical protein